MMKAIQVINKVISKIILIEEFTEYSVFQNYSTNSGIFTISIDLPDMSDEELENMTAKDFIAYEQLPKNMGVYSIQFKESTDRIERQINHMMEGIKQILGTINQERVDEDN